MIELVAVAAIIAAAWDVIRGGHRLGPIFIILLAFLFWDLFFSSFSRNSVPQLLDKSNLIGILILIQLERLIKKK